MLLCMWFMLVPPAQGLFLARNQSVVPAHHAPFNDISRQNFFGQAQASAAAAQLPPGQTTGPTLGLVTAAV